MTCEEVDELRRRILLNSKRCIMNDTLQIEDATTIRLLRHDGRSDLRWTRQAHAEFNVGSPTPPNTLDREGISWYFFNFT